MIHQKESGQVGKTISHYNILEKLGNCGMSIVCKSIEQYEKFLEIWKNADEDLPELIDARGRLGNCEMGNN